MPSLLQLDCSADRATSRSRALTAAFAETFRSAAPGNSVVHRDLHRDPLPHLPDAGLHWGEELLAAGVSVPADGRRLQQTLIDELLAADVLVVGVPLYNYSLPSALKAWIDHIHVPGVTASWAGSVPPLVGRPALLLTSRGTNYDLGTGNEGRDHAVPVLELILGDALGMAITVVSTDLTLAPSIPALADQVARSEAELTAARGRATELGRQLGSGGPAH